MLKCVKFHLIFFVFIVASIPFIVLCISKWDKFCLLYFLILDGQTLQPELSLGEIIHI